MLKEVLSVLCLVPAVATAQSYIVYDFTHDRVLESSSPNLCSTYRLGHQINDGECVP